VSGSWRPGFPATSRHGPAQPRAARLGAAGSNGALDRQFLTQRTEILIPEAPDSLMIVSVDLETGAYTQHY
jgi:hypothetical protein